MFNVCKTATIKAKIHSRKPDKWFFAWHYFVVSDMWKSVKNMPRQCSTRFVYYFVEWKHSEIFLRQNIFWKLKFMKIKIFWNFRKFAIWTTKSLWTNFSKNQITLQRILIFFPLCVLMYSWDRAKSLQQ